MTKFNSKIDNIVIDKQNLQQPLSKIGNTQLFWRILLYLDITCICYPGKCSDQCPKYQFHQICSFLGFRSVFKTSEHGFTIVQQIAFYRWRGTAVLKRSLGFLAAILSMYFNSILFILFLLAFYCYLWQKIQDGIYGVATWQECGIYFQHYLQHANHLFHHHS